jgi:hypothetical protein
MAVMYKQSHRQRIICNEELAEKVSQKASDFFKLYYLWCKTQAGAHFNIRSNTNQAETFLSRKNHHQAKYKGPAIYKYTCHSKIRDTAPYFIIAKSH